MTFNKRNVAAFLYSKWLIMSGQVNKVKARANKGEIILSVYFHDPSKELFEGCVTWFKKNGYNFLSLQEVEEVVYKHKAFPKNAVILTVDDGWKNNKPNIVEVAEKSGVPVTIFASTQPIETGEPYWWSVIAAANESGLISQSVSALKKVKNEERVSIVNEVRPKLKFEREALTAQEIREISDGGIVSIGSHTITHPILSTCSHSQSHYEISESRKIIESWLQKDVNHFAFPNGDYTARELKSLEESGYKLAFTTNPQYITPESLKNPLILPRFDVLETVSFAENICRMTGAWFNRKSTS